MAKTHKAETVAYADAARKLKAIGEPTRLRMLLALKQSPGLPCHALAEAAGVTGPNALVHIRTLRRAGLLRGDREGPRIHNFLSDAISRDGPSCSIQMGAFRFQF